MAVSSISSSRPICFQGIVSDHGARLVDLVRIVQ
jgi:hypothetical protein